MFKLAISDIVEFPVHFTVNDAGRTRTFNFTVQGRRVTQEEVDADRANGATFEAILEKNLTGWRGQALVIDAADKPAEFSVEALREMLKLRGVTLVLLAAYMEANNARGKEKN